MIVPWWVVASLLSNVAIIATEYINRHAPGGWLTILPQTLPLIIAAQFCLFVTFKGAPHWMAAWLVFALGNTFARVGTVYFLSNHEIKSWPIMLLGIATVLAGSFFVKSGLK